MAKKYVDLQEIDNALYYFDEDGALAENEDVDYYGTTYMQAATVS